MLLVDPLANLFQKHRISAKQAFWIGIFVIGLIEHALVPILGRYPNPFNRGTAFFLNSLAGFFQGAIATPIGYATYVWCMNSPNTFYATFIAVNKANTKISTKKMSTWFRSYLSKLSKKTNLYIVLFLTIFLATVQTYTFLFSEPEPWFGSKNYPHLIFVTFTSTLGYYMLWWIAIREILAVIWIRNFFSQFHGNITIIPSHPDKCGGYGPIGSHATRFGMFIAAVGLCYAIQVPVTVYYGAVQNTYGIVQIFGLIVFITISFFIFYQLLIPAHREMLYFKQETLKKISLEIQKYTNRIIPTQNLDEDAEHIERLNKLDSYVEAEFPTWPIKLISLRGITITVVIEILSLVLSALGLLYAG